MSAYGADLPVGGRDPHRLLERRECHGRGRSGGLGGGVAGGGGVSGGRFQIGSRREIQPTASARTGDGVVLVVDQEGYPVLAIVLLLIGKESRGLILICGYERRK